MEVELKDTMEFMTSKDYKERFIAEYWQLKIRYNKLSALLTKIDASKISDEVEEPKHDCPYNCLKNQLSVMGEYLYFLEVRAIIENIDLNSIFRCFDCDANANEE